MSLQVAVAERPLARPTQRRRPAFAGAGLVTTAMVVSGLLTYAFLVVTARRLGPEAYGQIGVLWGAMFIAAIVLFRPLEQTTSRAVSDRLARGEEAASVVRSVAVVCGLVLLIGGLAAIPAWSLITNDLFRGSGYMTLALLTGIGAYGASYLVRGLVAGVRWFEGYGIGLVGDAATRLLLAAPLLLVASQQLAAAAVAGAGAAGALFPLILGRSKLRLRNGTAEREFHVRAALGFAAPATIVAAADQLLVNGAPLLVALGGGSSRDAGIVFAATMLVRAPVYVFQGLCAALLPNLTHLHASRDAEGIRRSLRTMTGALLAVGAAITLGAAAAGPWAMHALYGTGFGATRAALALLGAGVGLYLAAATLSQGLLSLDAVPAAAACWLASAALFVAAYVVLPGSQLIRVSLALALATGAAASSLGFALSRRLSVEKERYLYDRGVQLSGGSG